MVKSIVAGIAIAAPLGPVGALCIRRTVSGGLRSGLLVGLGAATADGTFAAVASFGVGAIQEFIVSHDDELKAVGGFILGVLGVLALFGRRADAKVSRQADFSIILPFTSGFVLTITNPLTLMALMAILAGLGAGAHPVSRIGTAVTFVSGIAVGSLIWWLILNSLAHRFRFAMSQEWVVWVNRVCGFIILAFGIVTLLRVLGET